MITVICSDKTSVQLNREALLQIFPESILAQALQDDPEAKEMHLDNPLITEDVMKCVQGLLVGNLPPTENKLQKEPGIYLHIPMLSLVAQKEILEACNYRERRWKYHRPTYKQCMGAGRYLKSAELFRYGLRLMPEDAPSEYLLFLKDKVLTEGQIEITRVLLDDSRFPVNCDAIGFLLRTYEWQHHQFDYLGYCFDCIRDYTETFQLLLKYIDTFDGFEAIIDKLRKYLCSKYVPCFLGEARLSAYHDSLRRIV